MLALDHIVIAALDADTTRKQFTLDTGYHTYQGGKHENWGTYNYLSSFENQCYIEWLSVFDDSKAGQSENPLISHVASQLNNKQEGIAQIAFRTTKIDTWLYYYREMGIPFQGPFKGSRRKPDGPLIAWQMVFPLAPSGKSMPFLIEWHDRVPPQPADRSLINQRNIQKIEWGVENPESLKKLWSKLYQLPLPSEQTPFTWQLSNAEFSLTHGSKIAYTLE